MLPSYIEDNVKAQITNDNELHDVTSVTTQILAEEFKQSIGDKTCQ